MLAETFGDNKSEMTMKCWHYLQFVTGDEGSFTQNRSYKLSANSSYCIARTPPPYNLFT